MLKVRDITGIPFSTLQRHLKNRGLSRSNKDNSRRYCVNHNFFEVIDNEAKSYWLGFMYADGYISCRAKGGQKLIGISLHESDTEHLEKFKESLEATYPIKHYTNKSYGGTVDYARLLITSDKLFKDLRAKGAIEHKSLKLVFPDEITIPKNLTNHFIRGYFDGDGSWAKNNNGYAFKVCGTKEFLQTMLMHINFPNRQLRKRHKNSNNNWYCSIGGRKKALTIGNWMYKNATIYLQRKYDRYLEMKY